MQLERADGALPRPRCAPPFVHASERRRVQASDARPGRAAGARASRPTPVSLLHRRKGGSAACAIEFPCNPRTAPVMQRTSGALLLTPLKRASPSSAVERSRRTMSELCPAQALAPALSVDAGAREARAQTAPARRRHESTPAPRVRARITRSRPGRCRCRRASRTCSGIAGRRPGRRRHGARPGRRQARVRVRRS
jgi:hypothetical protein